MCAKHQRRCQELKRLREAALMEWSRAQTLHQVLAAWGRLGGLTTLHRYGRQHFSHIARSRTASS